MAEPIPIPAAKEEREVSDVSVSPPEASNLAPNGALRSASSSSNDGKLTSETPPSPGITPGGQTPGVLSRSTSYANSVFHENDDTDMLPPLDRLTVFDFLENLALPQRLERLQETIAAQTEKVRRQQRKLRSQSKQAREKVVEEWRKRIPGPEERLQKYRTRVRESVDRFSKRWSDARGITLREKISFIAGVLNIFVSGYFIGACPEYFHLWYSFQLAYYYPIRWVSYHKRGMHYFLADLCYFVNLLLVLSIWVFPRSKRLFISVFCLAFGNNAVAIAMWRNSLVFHSLDKVTSLFIHIMPCVTIHCLVHLIPEELRKSRFPAIYSIKHSTPADPEHFSLAEMALWATIPYAFWQLSYHFLITVRRREQIAAGRPTSFTWLRRSYSGTWIGKFVLSLPETLQEPAFMGIQYCYALLTMTPAPLWFRSRWASAGFLMVVFIWSVYNGAVYYIDIFGKRFEKELKKLKEDIARWQLSPEIGARTPRLSVEDVGDFNRGEMQFLNLGQAAMLDHDTRGHKSQSSVDSLPMLDDAPDIEGKVNGSVSSVTGEKDGTGESSGVSRTIDGGIVRERTAATT